MPNSPMPSSVSLRPSHAGLPSPRRPGEMMLLRGPERRGVTCALPGRDRACAQQRALVW